MKKYLYNGTNTTGATLSVNGKPLEVMLFPGRATELPESDPWVARMVRRGFLAELPEETTTARRTRTAAQETAAPAAKEAS